MVVYLNGVDEPRYEHWPRHQTQKIIEWLCRIDVVMQSLWAIMPIMVVYHLEDPQLWSMASVNERLGNTEVECHH